jgi:hypothetical protein
MSMFLEILSVLWQYFLSSYLTYYTYMSMYIMASKISLYIPMSYCIIMASNKPLYLFMCYRVRQKTSLIAIGFCKNYTTHSEQLILFANSLFDAILHNLVHFTWFWKLCTINDVPHC